MHIIDGCLFKCGMCDWCLVRFFFLSFFYHFIWTVCVFYLLRSTGSECFESQTILIAELFFWFLYENGTIANEFRFRNNILFGLFIWVGKSLLLWNGFQIKIKCKKKNNNSRNDREREKNSNTSIFTTLILVGQTVWWS